MALKAIDEHTNTNGILVSPSPDYGEGLAEAAITPGAVLIKGSSDGEVDEAGADAGDALGVALDNVSSEDEDLRADYAIGDNVRYARGHGFKFMGIATDAGTLTKGVKLACAADGELKLATADGPAEDVVAVYIGEADVAAPSSQYVLCKWVGA